jgi:TetR/AcrR family transcriptional regulator of autoinduction and epiphytic fitness
MMASKKTTRPASQPSSRLVRHEEAAAVASTAAAPQRLTDRKRQDILTAAIEEFRRNGFEGTSMDRVAAIAGVSKRTVYNHFPSKEVLFTEMMVQLWKSSAAQLDTTYRADAPLRDQLLDMVRQKLRMLEDINFIHLARVAIADGIHSPARAQEMVARVGAREEGLTVWIRAAAKDGRLTGIDPVFASNQLQALVKGFAFWPQITMGQPPLTKAMQEQVAATAVDMFLAQYASEMPAKRASKPRSTKPAKTQIGPATRSIGLRAKKR